MISFTINTDASYSWKYKRGAWAYWIKGDDLLIRKSGMFPESLKLTGSNSAELHTLTRAIREVNKIIVPKHRGAVKLFVNTDSLFAIQAINGSTKQSKNNMHYIDRLRDLAQGYSIEARHVKAHTNELEEPRKWVNDWCDKAVRSEMGRALYG